MTARYSNVSDVPLAIGVFLATDTYDHDDRPNVISATTLMKPLRQIILPKRIPEGMALPKLADQMRTSVGRAVHDAIERSWLHNYAQAMRDMGFPESAIERVRINPPRGVQDDDIIPVYVEQRVEKKVGNWIVTGKYDIVCDGRVQDYKTATVWSYMNQVNKEKQSQQGSLYKWLNPDIVYDDEIDIHHIFLDWSVAKTSDINYPRRMFIDQSIPLMSVAQTDQFVKAKLALIDKYWDADEDSIPFCTDDELWRSEPVFKYYTDYANAKRASKVFSDKQEAMIFHASKGKGEIVEFPGQVTACKYCNAFQACTQKDALIQSGHLTFTR